MLKLFIILFIMKHFNINNVHAMFTSSNLKRFLRNTQFYFKSLTRKSALFTLFQNGYFLLHDAKPQERIMGILTRSDQTHPKC